MPAAVYTVVAGPGSPFLDWAAASAHVVRWQKPISRIVLCTDRQTLDYARSIDHHILKVADEIAVAPPFDGTARERSRWVKTQMRDLVEGDFLYIDSDAIPVSDLSAYFDHDADIALVHDAYPVSHIAHWYLPAAERLGWRTPETVYLNSGIVFWRDNEPSRMLGRLWHDKWVQWHRQDGSGIAPDQPAFNSAVVEAGVSLKLMPWAYNAHLLRPIRTLEAPVIIHYGIAATSLAHYSLLATCARQLKTTGAIDPKLIEQARQTGNPWSVPYPLVLAVYHFDKNRFRLMTRMRRLLPQAMRRHLVR